MDTLPEKTVNKLIEQRYVCYSGVITAMERINKYKKLDEQLTAEQRQLWASKSILRRH